MSMRSSFSRTGSLSGDATSAGITTTGLTCSDRAEARRKLGGFWRSKTQLYRMLTCQALGLCRAQQMHSPQAAGGSE